MKIRSLLLGSVAAAGLSTGAYAADLGVLTSLDVCDALGLSGLTISSDTNCLQISGSVAYTFVWGDYKGPSDPTDSDGFFVFDQQAGAVDDGVVRTLGGYGAVTIPTAGSQWDPAAIADLNLDWESKVEAWIKFVATADSDFGPAKAVIKIKDLRQRVTVNEHAGSLGTLLNDGFFGPLASSDDTFVGGDDTGGPIFDEAYVAIGDTTVIMAGKKGTILNFGDDVPLNFLGLFNSQKVDTGVKWRKDRIRDGGHVIQIVHDLGNGVSIGGGLERLDYDVPASAGTAVGVISYAGDGLSAHLSVAADGILSGTVENWGYHAGVAGSFDAFKFVAAVSGDDSGYWNALGSVSASFDMFTIALSGEAASDGAATDYGFGGSVGFAVTDGITINLGSRYYYDDTNNDDGWQAAAQLVAAVTETIKLTGEIGVYGDVSTAVAPTNGANVAGSSWTGAEREVYYGSAEVAWAPGGGFTSSLKGEVFSNGAYRATFKAAKTFE